MDPVPTQYTRAIAAASMELVTEYVFFYRAICEFRELYGVARRAPISFLPNSPWSDYPFVERV